MAFVSNAYLVVILTCQFMLRLIIIFLINMPKAPSLLRALRVLIILLSLIVILLILLSFHPFLMHLAKMAKVQFGQLCNRPIIRKAVTAKVRLCFVTLTISSE